MNNRISTDNMQKDLNEYLTIKEAAEKLKKPFNTIRSSVYRGKIKAVKKGSQWLIHTNDLL